MTCTLAQIGWKPWHNQDEEQKVTELVPPDAEMVLLRALNAELVKALDDLIEADDSNVEDRLDAARAALVKARG